jgi:hypothetical protein
MQNAETSGDGLLQIDEYASFLDRLSSDPDCILVNSFGYKMPEPLVQTFDELSCLCKDYAGEEVDLPCCTSNGGIAIDGFYSDSYAQRVCARVTSDLDKECGGETLWENIKEFDVRDIYNSLTQPQTKKTEAPTATPTNAPTDEPMFTAQMVTRAVTRNAQATNTPTEKPKTLFGVLFGTNQETTDAPIPTPANNVNNDDDSLLSNFGQSAFNRRTRAPTASPTDSPTSSPTAEATSAPTATPTSSPTAADTTMTDMPTASPTSEPTKKTTTVGLDKNGDDDSTLEKDQESETDAPVVLVTKKPALKGTPAPKFRPTAAPTKAPKTDNGSSPLKTSDKFSIMDYKWIFALVIPIIISIMILCCCWACLSTRCRRKTTDSPKKAAKKRKTRTPEPTEDDGSDRIYDKHPKTVNPDGTMSEFLAVLEGLQESDMDMDSEMGEVTSSRYFGASNGVLQPRDLPPSPSSASLAAKTVQRAPIAHVYSETVKPVAPVVDMTQVATRTSTTAPTKNVTGVAVATGLAQGMPVQKVTKVETVKTTPTKKVTTTTTTAVKTKPVRSSEPAGKRESL